MVKCLLKSITQLYYRTDCLTDYSEENYHIRKNPFHIGFNGYIDNGYEQHRPQDIEYSTSYNQPIGYEDVIQNIICKLPNEKEIAINIGHNPLGQDYSNYSSDTSSPIAPIICDRLLLFGDNNKFDVTFKKLLFARPALLFKGQPVDHWITPIRYQNMNRYEIQEDFILCNEVSIKKENYNLLFQIKGQEYYKDMKSFGKVGETIDGIYYPVESDKTDEEIAINLLKKYNPSDDYVDIDKPLSYEYNSVFYRYIDAGRSEMQYFDTDEICISINTCNDYDANHYGLRRKILTQTEILNYLFRITKFINRSTSGNNTARYLGTFYSEMYNIIANNFINGGVLIDGRCLDIQIIRNKQIYKHIYFPIGSYHFLIPFMPGEDIAANCVLTRINESTINQINDIL